MKVGELVTQDVEDSTASAELEGKYYLILKCPLFRCTNVFPVGNIAYILQL